MEDHESTRSALDEMLTRFGFRPTLVDGPDAALVALERSRVLGVPYPLFLADATLPGQDAFDFVKSLQGRSLTGATVMMISTMQVARDIERCREAGADGHLRKPVRRKDLIRVMKHVLFPEQDSGAVPWNEPRALPAVPGGLKILIVEDNAFSQQVALMKLKRWGHHVHIVMNGTEALAALQNEAFDLLLTDLQMPDMDGYRLTEAIRTEESKQAKSRLPIIAVSAHAMKGVREQCLEAGMDDYVSKPIRDEELLTAMRHVLPQPESAAGDTNVLYGHDTAIISATLPTAFDEQAVLDRVGGNREVLQNLINVFYRDANQLVSRLKTAIHEGDAPEVRTAAHTIKGMVAFFGAKKATEHARHLEMLGQQADLTRVSESFNSLTRELSELEGPLARFAPSPPEGWYYGMASRFSEHDVCLDVG
jgi:CheY-like chemotaxis protein/HPt (histidine-containing phosphotransfer) domain-containing protein